MEPVEGGRGSDGGNLANFHKKELEEEEQLLGHLKVRQRGRLSSAEEVLVYPSLSLLSP